MNIVNTISRYKKVKNDPLGFLTDLITKIVVTAISPVPIPEFLVTQFKVPIIGFIVSVVALLLFFIISIGAVFLSPWMLGEKIQNAISSVIGLDNELNIPVNQYFTPTNSPKQNPLGGSGFEYSKITAYFLDPNYYLQFGRNHVGLDLIPSESYYKNSPVFNEYNKVIVYATLSGTASHYIDSYGGETVEVINKSRNTKIKLIHFSQVLVEAGEIVTGTPLGIMGRTGFATGDHVHYEVLIKDGDTWRAVNPLNYIN